MSELMMLGAAGAVVFMLYNAATVAREERRFGEWVKTVLFTLAIVAGIGLLGNALGVQGCSDHNCEYHN